MANSDTPQAAARAAGDHRNWYDEKCSACGERWGSHPAFHPWPAACQAALNAAAETERVAGTITPVADVVVLPTPAEQQAEYQRRKAQFDREYEAWKAGGEQGPPPPRPVPPHTPGWAPLPAAAPVLPRVTESGEFPPPAVPKLALGATSLVEAYDRMQQRIFDLERELEESQRIGNDNGLAAQALRDSDRLLNQALDPVRGEARAAGRHASACDIVAWLVEDRARLAETEGKYEALKAHVAAHGDDALKATLRGALHELDLLAETARNLAAEKAEAEVNALEQRGLAAAHLVLAQKAVDARKAAGRRAAAAVKALEMASPEMKEAVGHYLQGHADVLQVSGPKRDRYRAAVRVLDLLDVLLGAGAPACEQGGAQAGQCPSEDDGGYQCELPAGHDGPHRAIIGAHDEQGPIPERVWSTPTPPRAGEPEEGR